MRPRGSLGKKKSPALTAGLECFSVALATGGKTTRSARLRGGLQVIDGKTLLPKLSYYASGAPNFALITRHRADEPQPAQKVSWFARTRCFGDSGRFSGEAMREFFDNTQIKAMHAAFEAACVELGMGPRDRRDRQRIAEAILTVARQGQADAELMKALAVRRLTTP